MRTKLASYQAAQLVLAISDREREKLYKEALRHVPFCVGKYVSVSHAYEATEIVEVGALVVEYTPQRHKEIEQLIHQFRSLISKEGAWMIIIDTHNAKVWISKVIEKPLFQFKKSVHYKNRNAFEMGLDGIHAIGLLNAEKPFRAVLSYNKGLKEYLNSGKEIKIDSEDEMFIESIRLLFNSKIGAVYEIKKYFVQEKKLLTDELKLDLKRECANINKGIQILSNSKIASLHIKSVLKKYPMSTEIAELSIKVDPTMLLKNRCIYHATRLINKSPKHPLNRTEIIPNIIQVKNNALIQQKNRRAISQSMNNSPHKKSKWNWLKRHFNNNYK